MIKLRKLLACLMIACMAFSLMPLAAFATEGEDGDVSGEPCTHVWQAAGGKHVCSGCSEEAAHSFDSNGVCTVCKYECKHENAADGACPDCGMTLVQEQSDTQDDNSTAGENGGGAAGGDDTTGGSGTPADNDTPDGSGTPDDNGENKASVTSQTGENGTEGETSETANNVAKIGEKGYETLDAALKVMQPGDTVTLLKDVEGSFSLETNGTIDLNDKTIVGEVIIKADIELRTGMIIQRSGQATAAVVLIKSGSLKLEGTYVNAGDYGGILVDSAETVSVELAGTITSSEYGIMQSESSTGTLNVTSDPASGISGSKYGVYIRNGSYTARTTDEDTDDLNVRSSGTAIKIDKGSLSISGDKGSFLGALEIAEGVTCSITGGSFTEKPSVDKGYLAVYDEATKSYNVIPGVVVNDVTVKADVTGGSAPVTAADGITAPSGAASFACGSSVIDVQKLLTASKLTFAEGDVVSIELIPDVKIEAVEQDKNDNTTINSIEYAISPKAKITVTDGAETQTETIPVTNDMLKGSIGVTIPTVDGFNVLTQIVHIRSDGSTEDITKYTFVNKEVSFNVSSFSNFMLYRSSMPIEVLDRTGKFSARYNDLDAAAAAVEDNGTVKLLSGITSGEVTVNTRAFTLDLAGQTLKLTAAIQIADNGNITIKDSATGGKIMSTGTPAISVNSSSAGVTIENGTVTGGVKMNANGDIIISKTDVVEGAPAVDASAGVVMINGGTVTGTDASKPAINVTGSATLILEERDNNVISVTNAGGTAIEINGANNTDTQFRMESGTVNGGTTGVNVLCGDVKISGGTVEGGTTGMNVHGGDVMIDGGAIKGATAINADGGSIRILNGTLDSAAAPEVTTSGTATVEVTGGSFAHAVPEAQCPSGYVPCADPKNTTRYSVALMVAQSKTAGGVTAKHATVQDAINAAGVGGTVTLLADSSNPGATSNSMTIDGNGKKMGTLNVNAAAKVTVKNLKATEVNVAESATADFSGADTEIGKINNKGTVSISAGKYKTIGGEGTCTYSITGGLFGIKVDDKWCAKVPVSGKTVGSASSLTKYIAVANTDAATKDAYPYRVTEAPAPRITKISNSAYFQRNSDGTLTIYTDRTVDELVENTNTYQKDKYPYRCLNVTSANGSTSSVSPSYYTVTEDDNGNAVITISNGFLKYKPVGTYSVQVEYTTGVTQWENFKIGTSPKTGDESNIGLWIGIMACSVIIIGCGVFVLIHKSKKNKK